MVRFAGEEYTNHGGRMEAVLYFFNLSRNISFSYYYCSNNDKIMKKIFGLFISLQIFSSLEGFSQVGQWTWMGGDSLAFAIGAYGIKGVPSVLNKPAGREYPAYWTDTAGNFWLCGGSSFTSLNDLWKYNPSTSEWSWVAGTRADSFLAPYKSTFGVQGIPSSANTPGYVGSGYVPWTDYSNNLWLYDGTVLWKFNIAISQWTWMKGDTVIRYNGVYGIKGIPNSANYFGTRQSSCRWVDNLGNLWLFGGSQIRPPSGSQLFNDLWKYSLSTNEWTWISGDSIYNQNGFYGVKGLASPLNKPGARIESYTWTDDAGNLWMYGGEGNTESRSGKLNDLWQYNITTNLWTWVGGDSLVNARAVYGVKGVAALSNKPGARQKGFTWTDETGNLWLAGGTGYSESSEGGLNDFWKYDIPSNRWTWVAGDSSTVLLTSYGAMGVSSATNHPGERFGPAGWVDRAKNFWQFGGEGYITSDTDTYYLNDFWRYQMGTAVPLHLITFTAHLQDQTTHLQWTTANEQNFSHYEIERSNNSREFAKVGRVNWKGVSEKNEYSYANNLDGLPSAINRLYYRLKMVDKDGKFTYSNIVEIKLPTGNGFTVYPNPASTHIQLQFNKSLTGKTNIVITDAAGKVVLSTVVNILSSVVSISTVKLAAGSYTVKVISNLGTFSRHLVVGK